MVNETGQFIGFINFCNSQLVHTTDYAISRAVLSAIAKEENLSIESVALEANTSQASVSRFIRKAGFSSFAKAISDMRKAKSDLKLSRLLAQNIGFPNREPEHIVDVIFQHLLQNLRATRHSLDLEKLQSLVGMMECAKSITFLGDAHSLALFFTLQLDLMSKGKVAYLYQREDFVSLHERFLEQPDLVIYLSVSDLFLREEHLEMMKQARSRGTKIAVFAQEKLTDLDSDWFYQYGLQSSMNDGYYSLYFISQVLSELVVKKEFK